MIFRPLPYKYVDYINFILNDVPLDCISRYKYLDHILSDYLRDDEDINCQLEKLYARGNAI